MASPKTTKVTIEANAKSDAPIRTSIAAESSDSIVEDVLGSQGLDPVMTKKLRLVNDVGTALCDDISS